MAPPLAGRRRRASARIRSGSRRIQQVSSADNPDPPAADQPDGAPIIPHATPVLDGSGNISYIGDDGRRYVVGLPTGSGDGLLERIIGLCELWISQQEAAGLERHHALVLLLTSLESALQPPETGR
jgi:hypothetical protein